MSCPDWPRLSAAREAAVGEAPSEWRDALAHLGGCPRCRREAPAHDPLLLLRELPEPELEPDEGRRMVAAVRALARRDREARRWTSRAAAAAALVALGAALAAAPLLNRPDADAESAGHEAPGGGREAAPVADLVAVGDEPDEPWTASVLELDGLPERVYEVTNSSLAVVVVVDERLDLEDRG